MLKEPMATKSKAQPSHPRIVLGLPDIQDQLRVIDRLLARATDSDRDHLASLGNMLSEFYAQLQHQKRITIYRFGSKTHSKSDAR